MEAAGKDRLDDVAMDVERNIPGFDDDSEFQEIDTSFSDRPHHARHLLSSITSKLISLRHRPATPAWIKRYLRRLEDHLDAGDAAVLEPYRWEWLSVLLTRLLSFIMSRIPVFIAYPLCDRLAEWLFYRLHNYRNTVRSNLWHVYRGQIDEEHLERQAKLVFRTLVRTTFDVVTIPYTDKNEFLRSQTIVEGSWEELDELIAERKGAILMSGHIGPFDWIGQLIMLREGYNPIAMTLPTVSKMVFTAITFLRSSNGFRIATLNPSSMKGIMSELRKGSAVAIVADRNFGEGGFEVTYFGEKTKLPVGPVRLARSTGAPIVPLFAIRNDLHTNRRAINVFIGKPIYVEQTSDRRADVARGMEQIVRVFEHYISLAPEQWVMYQNVWPASAGGPDAVSVRHRDGQPDPGGSNGSVSSDGALRVPPDEAGLDRAQHPVS